MNGDIRATLRAVATFLTVMTLQAFGAGAAHACELKLVGQLPVELGRGDILVDVGINGHPAKLIVDTGSNITSLWRDKAEELKVKLGNTVGTDIYGVGGRSAIQLAYLNEISIGKAVAHNFRVYVIGSPSVEKQAAGLLGSDFLSQADVDFDLADNKVNLIRENACTGPQMIYWNKPYSQAPMRGGDAENTSFYVTVLLNGHPIEAEIDSGSSVTVIDASLAQRLGAVPLASPVVDENGRGIGYKTLPEGVARFDSFTLGDETIKNAKIRTAPLFNAIKIEETGSRLGSHENAAELPRMLLGLDFLRAHRILLSSSHQMAYFTYLGGPVFDVTAPPNKTSPTPKPSVAPATTPQDQPGKP